MARPLKTGLDYFSMDCWLDNKLKLIEAEFGLKGFAIVVKLWQWIYRNGYYCEWDDDIALLFASQEGSNCGAECVKEIVYACLRRDIFSKELFDKYHILTSSGVQKRFAEATVGRSKVEMKKEYLLINAPKNKVSEQKTPVSEQKTPIIKADNSQSKVKESKVKKSKENNKHGAIENSSEQNSEKVVIQLILNDKSQYDVCESDVTQWENLFPAVDVIQELRTMSAWCIANPKKRKTRKGINRFIVSWLSKKQDQGGVYPSVGNGNSFKPSRT